MLSQLKIFNDNLSSLQQEKLLINTINAHSYNVARKDETFFNSLKNCQVLIPDGIGIVLTLRLLGAKSVKKIAGADLFYYEMHRLNASGGKCFFLGSRDDILDRIKQKAAIGFPNVDVASYSPPYVPQFSKAENEEMIRKVNDFAPDVLFIGMTAPKQEKWAYEHFDQLKAGHIASIGAVFDFYAGTVKRAPKWMIKIGMEWLYRLFKEPKRMWRRYLIGNTVFIWNILKYEVFSSRKK